MAEVATMTKLLHVREQEKTIAQKAYQQSVDVFEEIGGKLYHSLRKKEDAEARYEQLLCRKTSINMFKQQLNRMEQLNKQVNRLQTRVQKARQDMEAKQIKLTDAHVEAKKYEKLIEHRKQQQLEQLARVERTMMDELSIQQFMNNGNR